MDMYSTAKINHLLKHHLAEITKESDIACLISDYFSGKLSQEHLTQLTLQLIWNSLTICQRYTIVLIRLKRGKPLDPVKCLENYLPVTQSKDKVRTKHEMKQV